MTEPTPGVVSAASDRRSFVRAFVRGPHGQRKPGRLALRPAALIGVILAVALIAVAIGAIPALLRSSPSHPTAAAPAHPATSSGVPSPGNPTPAAYSGLGGGGLGADGLNAGGSGGGGSSSLGGGGAANQPAPGPAFGGGGTGGGSGGPAVSHAAPARPAPPQPNGAAPVNHPTYAAIVGEGCANSTGHYSTSVIPGTSGWLKSSGGGFRANGCNGNYDSIPMWGSASGWDQGAFAAYQWNFSSMFTAGTCHFSVYVPNNNATYVGGNPAFYHYWPSDYFNSKATSGFGQFTVNQTSSHGNWVDSPAFGVSSGHVDLIVVNTGVDNRGQHVAAAPIALTCTKS